MQRYFHWLALLLCALTSLPAAAATFGTIDATSGQAVVVAADGRSRPVTAGTTIAVGERIETGRDGEVHVVTVDDGFVAVRPDSQLRADAYQATGADDDNVAMTLLKGALRSITGWIGKRKPTAYKLATTTATIGIRGTDHEVTLVETADGTAGTYLAVSEGEAVLTAQGGEGVAVPAGKLAFAARDGKLPARLLDRLPAFLERKGLALDGRIAERKRALLDKIRERIEQRRDAASDADDDAADDADDANATPDERRARERRRALTREMKKRLRERRPN